MSSPPNPYQAPKKTLPGEPLPSEESGWVWIMFQFTGRIPRSTFWVGNVILAIVMAVLWCIGWILGNDDDRGIGSLIAAFIIFCVYVPAVWSSIGLQVKRWHDMDKSGWWYWISWIPIVGWVWAFIALGFISGSRGPNRYGPDRLP
jgi:uncharacterized membrane protein YhaH (DUF805 family)